MDDADIGADAFVAAMSFVKAGTEVAPRTLVGGIPARVIRPLKDEEIAWKTEGTKIYQDLARRYLATARAVEPLREVEPDRPELPAIGYQPKHEQA